MKQAVDLGINIPFFATGSSATQQFIDLVGKAGEGVYSLSFTEVSPDDPQVKKDFVASYEKRFGVAPDMFAIATYDAAYIVAEGLKNAYKNNGNQFPKDLSKFRSDLRVGISQINGLQLCQGKIVWNKYQEAATNVQFVQWKGGKKAIVQAIPAEKCILPGE
jgi:branched-chain amino acid transport system substrate-binding protein